MKKLCRKKIIWHSETGYPCCLSSKNNFFAVRLYFLGDFSSLRIKHSVKMLYTVQNWIGNGSSSIKTRASQRAAVVAQYLPESARRVTNA